MRRTPRRFSSPASLPPPREARDRSSDALADGVSYPQPSAFTCLGNRGTEQWLSEVPLHTRLRYRPFLIDDVPEYSRELKKLAQLEFASLSPDVRKKALEIASHPGLVAWLGKSDALLDSPDLKCRADLAKFRRRGIQSFSRSIDRQRSESRSLLRRPVSSATTKRGFMDRNREKCAPTASPSGLRPPPKERGDPPNRELETTLPFERIRSTCSRKARSSAHRAVANQVSADPARRAPFSISQTSRRV